MSRAPRRCRSRSTASIRAERPRRSRSCHRRSASAYPAACRETYPAASALRRRLGRRRRGRGLRRRGGGLGGFRTRRGLLTRLELLQAALEARDLLPELLHLLGGRDSEQLENASRQGVEAIL